MRMAAFLLRRLLGLIGVLLGMSVLIFGIIHILPGNVAYSILGEFATPAAVAQLEAKLRLNDPLPGQYRRCWTAASCSPPARAACRSGGCCGDMPCPTRCCRRSPSSPLMRGC